jgi:hypothetical protein
MDQSYFAGPGNIYRAEILFKAGIHPDKSGMDLERDEFDEIWSHTVALLNRGYKTGSILTVDPEEARALGKPKLRRYIYNSKNCPRCKSPIKTWDIANRRCYACPKCQPLVSHNHLESIAVVTPARTDCVPFNSHCARDSIDSRLTESGPSRLTVKEIKAQLTTMGIKIPSKTKKADLVELLTKTIIATKLSGDKERKPAAFVSPEDAASEKARAGESLAVEHIAELAPGQARNARARVLFPIEGDVVGNPKKVTVKRKASLENKRSTRKSKR